MPKNYFNPVQDLSDKNNYKLYHLIKKDGTIIERVILETTTKKLRENIIFYHLMFILGFKKNDFKIISRDKPWDFEVIDIKNNKFYMEITSISENNWSFEKKTSEEKFKEIQLKSKVSLGELRKLATKFYQMNNLNIFLEKFKSKPRDVMIDNPLYKSGPYIFISDSKEYKYSYMELLEQAIQKKLNKKHNKDNLILVLDDRTISFQKKEHDRTLKKLVFKYQKSSFLMIWLYIGYYSNNDGLNSEFYLKRIK